MTTGVGGSDAATELATIRPMLDGVEPIAEGEYRARLERARALLADSGAAAMYLNAGTNLRYFTGTLWSPSERLVGAILTAGGDLHYIAPAFERDTLTGFMVLPGELHCWEEHEDPYRLVAQLLADGGHAGNTLAVDESAPFFLVDGLSRALPDTRLIAATDITRSCRACKSDAELALMQRAKDITLQIHRHTARILRPGITTAEVREFIHAAHRAAGTAGSYFCIVLFGPDSAFPHGVAKPKALADGDMVLIDTGCQVEDYISDITRSYVFGEPTARQREIWAIEKAAQQAAFAAVAPGKPCGTIDAAARGVIEGAGLGPDYQLPGLPHRTGHGIGLDIHEAPYLVRGDDTPLEPGMCFSNEPMICVPGHFGVRLEDHFHVTDDGARWFTRPSTDIDDPFRDVPPPPGGASH
ncbi:MAG: Xaa-Pro peptidase family protein [Chromatocurvus sp.]